ncbi:MAG TPA: hypothetical protein VFQ58_09330, partial [Flavisolibacter sp.]|nr:hypothetical protein [Flavisolibacter sp.]
MKKFFAAILIFSATACNNSGSNSTSADSNSSDIKPVKNVNGNIPDTTSGAADITGKQKIDTTKIDSSRIKK